MSKKKSSKSDPFENFWDTPRGKLSIFPRIGWNNQIEIAIWGDAAGLEYLADIIKHFASLNISEVDIPEGAREHTILSCRAHLSGNSSNVEICRADAKGTGALPDFFADGEDNFHE